MRTRLLLSCSLLSAALLASACGGDDAADPETLQQRLRSILPGLVDPTIQAVNTTGESSALAGLSDSLAAIDQLGLPFSVSPGGDESFEPVPAADGEEPTGDELAEMLASQIFTEENHEGGGVYRIPASLVCEDDTGAVDPECAEQFDQLELRIRAVLAEDGLDFTLLVGPDRAAPLTVELRPARAALVVDLGETAAALTHVASVTGEEIVLPDELAGQIAVGLEVRGDAHVAIGLAVRERVVIAMPAAGGRFDFSTEARDPLIELDLDGSARQVALLLDLGRTVVSMPMQEADPFSLATGTWALDWKGLSMTATARDGEDRIELTNIGLGDDTSTLSLDDTVLVAIDLNAADGRRLDVTLAPAQDGGLPTATFTPGLDLVVDLYLQPLADAGDAVESWLLDDTYRIALDGDRPVTQAIEADELAGTPGALRVGRGTLTVANDGGAVVVEAGSCLLADPVEDGEHPVLGALAAGACP